MKSYAFPGGNPMRRLFLLPLLLIAAGLQAQVYSAETN